MKKVRKILGEIIMVVLGLIAQILIMFFALFVMTVIFTVPMFIVFYGYDLVVYLREVLPMMFK